MQLPVALHSKSNTKIHRASNPNFNLPNSLTVSRILLIPVFVILFSTPSNEYAIAATLVFVIAALTDFLDGYLARRNSQVTTLGRFLDPIADKLLVVASLILLVEFHRVEAWLAIAITTREIVIIGLRSIAAAEGIIVASGTMGKYKTFCQISGIILLIFPQPAPFLSYDHQQIGAFILYGALALGVVSGIGYILKVLENLSSQKSIRNST